MQALGKVVTKLDSQTRHVLMVACLLVDDFKRDPTPANLDAAQDFLRAGIRDTRRLIQQQGGRDQRRGSHFRARIRRSPELGRIHGAHIRLIASRRDLLNRRRKALRACADALAWICLADKPATIPRLYRPQTHELPELRGSIGHHIIIDAAHRSGEFLVIENDLTRCLGLGDLTVVPLTAPDLPPISVEVKTHTVPGSDGKEVTLETALIEIDHPRAQEVLSAFNALVGPPGGTEQRGVIGETKQMVEFFAQAQDVIRAHSSRPASLGIVTGNWDTVRRVLDRSTVGGPCMDLAEPGVWIGAVRLRSDGTNFSADYDAVLRQAKRMIPMSEDYPLRATNTLDLEAHEVAAGLAMPVAVWDLPPRVRAEVLNGDLVLVSFTDFSKLEALLAARGIAAELDEHQWRLTRDGEEVALGAHAVTRARLDVAFGGLSFISMADRLDEALAK